MLRLIERFNALCAHSPLWLIQLLGRMAIAGVFWRSGQTKIQGFALDPLAGRFEWGIPAYSDSVLDLFRDEYRLPLVSPEIAAPLAILAEHLFPILLVLGLATRLSAVALLGMTIVIQIFVYPDAWPVHGTWAAVLLMLVRFGAGPLSLDHWLAGRSMGGSGAPHLQAR